MVRPLKARSKIKIPKKVLPQDMRSVTPLIWYGGKSRDAKWIIDQFPPHDCFVDVFGGGAAITFGKLPSKVDIYNDIGNVSNFFWTLREYADELFERLSLTVFGRDEFDECTQIVKEFAMAWAEDKKVFRENISDWERVEWARAWYVVVMESFTHEENASSWKTTKTLDLAFVWRNKVDELPYFAERLRHNIIENRDFMQILVKYDSPQTLFYLDPPYTPDSRKAKNNYQNELPIERHEEMLRWLTTKLQGQAIVSMYDDPLYSRYLKNWRRKEITHKSQIHNNSHDPASTGNSRTEVIWVREHQYGLWSLPEVTATPAQTDVSGVRTTEI